MYKLKQMVEPIISVYSLVSVFFGYYIGTDIFNYIKFNRNHNLITEKLERIENSINALKQ